MGRRGGEGYLGRVGREGRAARGGCVPSPGPVGITCSEAARSRAHTSPQEAREWEGGRGMGLREGMERREGKGPGSHSNPVPAQLELAMLPPCCRELANP